MYLHVCTIKHHSLTNKKNTNAYKTAFLPDTDDRFDSLIRPFFCIIYGGFNFEDQVFWTQWISKKSFN